MGCKVAENLPLSRLAKRFGLPIRCHGRRHACIQNLAMESDDVVLGVAGAVIGYCQALFSPASRPAEHTEKVTRLLAEIDAPWSQSHELFLGHRGNLTTASFVSDAFEPLRGTGRVPILITGLDPATDGLAVSEILESRIPVPESQSVLFRVVLKSPESIDAIAKLILNLVSKVRETGSMPAWWPLLQSSLSVSEWERLREVLGEAWDYVNIAVNPYADPKLYDFAREQITVGQVVVGSAEGIHENGRIEVGKEMGILGSEGQGYSLSSFVQMLGLLPIVPTLIVLGPSQPGWDDSANKERIAKLLPLLRSECDQLWHGLSPDRRDEVWNLNA